MNAKIHQQLANRKSRIERRLDKKRLSNTDRPMFTAANIQYEIADRNRCISVSAKVQDSASGEQTADKDTFDQAALLIRVRGNVGLMLEILTLCVSELPRMMTELEIAVSEKDPKRIQSAAHTLKGSLGNLSANAAYEAALSLEGIAQKGELDCVAELFRLVQDQVHRVKLAVAKVHSDLMAGKGN